MLLKIYRKLRDYYGHIRIRRLVLGYLSEESAFASEAPEGYLFFQNHIQYFETPQDELPDKLKNDLNIVAEEYKKRMEALLNIFHGKIILTFIPPKETYALRNDILPYREFCKIFEVDKDNIYYFNFINEYHSEKILDLYYKIDTHFNSIGHAEFSKFIVRNLKNNNVITE